MTTGFNPTYLLDGLQAVNAPFAVLSFTDPKKAAVLQGAESLDAEPMTSYRYLAMPVRISS